MVIRSVIAFTIACLVSTSVFAQAAPLVLKDYRGEEATFPQGELSFADKVLYRKQGYPSSSELTDPNAIIGLPDWNEPDTVNYVNYPDFAYSLGCRGEIAIQFTDNVLVDGPGPDLFIFEIGKNVEGAQISVSNDGVSWELIGRVGGAFSTVDLSDFELTSPEYRYVLIKDVGDDCRPPTPGADIDAVGAIGSAKRITLEGAMLFDFDSHELRAEAKSEIQRIIRLIQNGGASRVKISGHTDSKGSENYNNTLGLNRAGAVSEYIQLEAPDLISVIETLTNGEDEPVATNDTEEGRQKNRRVEITIFE